MKILRKWAGLTAVWAAACSFGIARADAFVVTAVSVAGPSVESGLPSMYSGHMTAAEFAADNLFDLSGGRRTGLGVFAMAAGEIAQAAFALPFNFSGAWVTSFSNLNLPAGVYWELVSDPRSPPDFRDWIAVLPPAFIELPTPADVESM